MSEKWISVIIPCYNAEKYMEECLESLVNQTIGIEHMEIIIIDDASTDSSRECMLKYQSLYPNSIKLILLDKNEGQANARNLGIDTVSASYLTFVDADDWVDLEIYEKMLIPAKQYGCDLISCGCCEHLEGLAPQNMELNIPQCLYNLYDIETKKKFFQKYDFGGMIGVTLYRTDFIKDNKFKFKSFLKYEDNYWNGIIKYAVSTYYPMKGCMYHYRLLPESNSRARNDIRHFDRLEVELEKLAYYLETGLFQIYYKEIRNDFLQLFYVNTLHIICCQFDYFPLEQVQMMQAVVKEVYPDYLDYCRESTRFINPVLTVAFNFPLEKWNHYKEAYWKWASQGEEKEIAQIYLEMRSALSI